MPNQAPPGYVKNNIIPGVGYINMVKYLTMRGYSPDLAQTLATNIEANPDFRSNQELVAGAQAWVAKNALSNREVDPALGAINIRDQYAASQAQGQKADSLASYFQRLGMPADQALTLAHHATGIPDSTGKAPLEHAQTQVAEHPPISPEVYKAALAARNPDPSEGSGDSNYTWDGQKWIPSKGK